MFIVSCDGIAIIAVGEYCWYFPTRRILDYRIFLNFCKKETRKHKRINVDARIFKNLL
jgi:hypothetical protein